MHDGFDLLVFERAIIILKDEVDGITLLPLWQVLALVHVEELNLLQQFLVGLHGNSHNIFEQNLLIKQQRKVATNSGELTYLFKLNVLLANLLVDGRPIEVGKEHFVSQVE